MLNLRELSVLAITALLVAGMNGVSAVGATARTPTTSTTCLTSTSLTVLITCFINSIGDDAFSTINLSTLVGGITTVASPTQHYTTSMASPSSSGTSTQHFGPYAGGSTDSGTCGNDWAQDTFDRHFTVFQNGDGSLLVVEQFKDGSFATPASDSPQPNPSPGACQNGPGTGTVANGVTGTLHGYFVIPLPPGIVLTNSDSSCVAFSPSTPCTTTGFINSHFTPACYPSTCSVKTFFFHYTAPITSTAPNSGLIQNEWKNASADRGGNTGDIRSA